MNAQRWKRIEEILHGALREPPAKRQLFLDDACAGDESLRHDVQSLLKNDQEAEDLLASSLGELAASIIAGAATELPPGTRIASYTIDSLLDRGGMGVVYRARDERLDRQVALKILPEIFARDPERAARFKREAKAVAALSHPNVLAIHDFGNAEGMTYAAMELLEGETLRARLNQGALPVRKAIEYAVQIAAGLAAAHQRGVVHRDLKPENLFITNEGRVKILDFGLAKRRREIGFEDGTGTLSATAPSVVMGTIGYMSPEQVRGQDVDARSDIFSFGAILYEMLADRRAFSRDSGADTLGAILREDPPNLSGSDRAISPSLERVVRRCLEKSPAERFQSARDLGFALEAVSTGSGTASDRPGVGNRGILPSVLGAPAMRSAVGLRTALAFVAVIGLLAAFTALWFKRDPLLPKSVVEAPLPVVPLSSYPGYERDPSFSPDGSQVAFSWAPKPESPYDSDIYVKQVGSESFFRLTADDAMETDSAWSPDGRWIAFLRTSEGCSLVVKPPLGGGERTLADIPVLPGDFFWDQNVAWHPEAKWVVAPDRPTEREPFALVAISLETGEKRRLTSPPAGSIGDSGAAFSPNGTTLAFSRWAAHGRSSVYLVGVSDRLVPVGEPKQVTFNYRDFDPEWTPHGNEIVYVSGSVHATSLWRVDPKQPGNPRPLAVPGRTYAPAFSRKGQLAFAQLLLDVNVWEAGASVGKERVSSPVALISSTYVDHNASFSHDGRHIAFVSYRSGASEIWICDRDGSNPAQRTWFGGPSLDLPVWSPDGKQIAFAFSAETSSEIYVINSQGGKPRRLTAGGGPCYSRDGKWLYFESGQGDQSSIYRIPAQGGEKVQVTRDHSSTPKLSPDGRYIYYLKPEGSLWRMPIDGGAERKILPAVHHNNYAIVGRGVYFMPGEPNPDWSIDFLDFRTGKPTRLLRLPRHPQWGFDVSPDGKELLYSQNDNLDADLLLIENFR